MKKMYASLLIFVLIMTPLLTVSGQTRGVGVRVKNEETDKTEEVTLYKASFALVIGVSDYIGGWPDLPGVKDDVAAVSAVLEKQGFQVTTVIDPKKEDLVEAIRGFINDHGYDFENRLLFYYAGHGSTLKAGAGYEQGFIVPADAPKQTAENKVDFRRYAVSMDSIEGYAREINAKHALFVFDSCFSGALISKTRAAVPPNITQKATQPVRQFITAGTDDQEVPDVSEFRKQFVLGLEGEADLSRDGYITASELADFLQDKVSRYMRGTQTPQYGKIRDARLDKGDFVFISPVGVAASGGNTVVSQPSTTTTTTIDTVAIQKEFWESIKDSTDVRDFRLYKEKYPNGAYRTLADLKISRLSRETTPPVNTANNTANNSNNEAALKAGAIREFGGMSFAYIPAGEFEMGSNNGESYEKPVHQVRISKGYWMGTTEVTQEQWEKVMGSNPSYFKNCGKCPVENVSWDDVQGFIRKLNSQTNDGSKYRLPTEAEWEYAARAGTTGDYAGDLDSMGWYKKNSGSKTHEAGTKRANGWGLYDMHGNVWEWVEDWYGGYPSGSVTDPMGPATGSLRVSRGGGWYDTAPDLRSAFRGAVSPGDRNITLGFRLVRTL